MSLDLTRMSAARPALTPRPLPARNGSSALRIRITSPLRLFFELIELHCAGGCVGDNVLAIKNNGRWHNGSPRGKIGCAEQVEAGVVGRPGDDDVLAGGRQGEARQRGNGEWLVNVRRGVVVRIAG